MDTRRVALTVAQNVSAAMSASGATAESVAQAADLTLLELRSRLAGESDFTFEELARVGGFLHASLGSLLKGVA